jgi:Tfp pilus assembly protein PilF
MTSNQTIGAERELKPFIKVVRKILVIASLGCFANWAASIFAQTTNEIRIVELQGLVEISPKGASTWVRTQTNQTVYPFDRLRTGPNSRVALRWSDESVVPFGAQTELEILPPHATDAEPGLHLIRGIISFFHRDKPSRIRVITRGATAGIEGTEFVMEVADSSEAERTTLSVIDGRVSFTNEQAALVLTNGQQAVAEPGKAPVRTAGFNATNLLQWCFYYPAVLDLNDLSLTTEEQKLLGDSLAAYRAGDLLTALAKYPDARQPGSDAQRIYHSALLLSVGQVEKAEANLSTLTATGVSEKLQRLAAALRTLIAAVKREKNPSMLKPQLATELLAASYFEQSRAVREKSLTSALHLARQAVTASPDFGFGWERVAELEFSFGRTDRALEDLNRSLALAPRNAQALALQGFLLAAQNKTREAIDWFDRALAVDSALGNAWLGRGLCRIRRGDTTGGHEDLLIAAALEPQRAALRSYLGKAWSDAGDDARARKELRLAQKLDPKDPTSWLYSALNNEQHNRINEAIGDLEKSQELNEDRSVYRSGLLLDQDRAVRSANLARIYAEAGMEDVALREASRAVASDYGNYSAHLFLADSYEQLRQSSPFDLRFETPAFSEYLIASLLGPADGRILAQPVTQQEYTRLFERDTFGFSSSTEYLSRGAWSQYAAQYGTVKNFSYALETDYQSDPGQTPNSSVETKQLSLKLKQMLTPRDGLFVQVLDFRKTSGDLSQRYDASQADIGFEAREKQEPSVLVGLDHKWSDTQHTLLLASRFNDSLAFKDPHGPTYLLAQDSGQVFEFAPTDLTENFKSRLTVDSFELQHLMGGDPFQTIAGIRFQHGSYRLANEQSFEFGNASGNEIFFDLNPGGVTIVTNQSLETDSLRITPYLYEHWHVTDTLWLIGGVALDYQSQPRNALFAPVEDGHEIQRQFSPKAGLIWKPTLRTAVRAAYSKSLGGASLDQSVRLEPTQLAGFTQAYRNLIPDSLAGGVGGEHFETADISVEHQFPTRTYVALSAELLRSKADQAVGAFLHDFNAEGPAVQIMENLRFQERSAEVSLHQLLGDCFSLGARYHLSDARLALDFPEIDPSTGVTSSTSRGLLHQISLEAVFQHPCGFFAEAQGRWWAQELKNDLSSLPGDRFWQANLMAGFRSPRRHVEISVGLLNVTGQDYRLHPINLYPDLSRERTFVTRLQLNF